MTEQLLILDDDGDGTDDAALILAEPETAQKVPEIGSLCVSCSTTACA